MGMGTRRRDRDRPIAMATTLGRMHSGMGSLDGGMAATCPGGSAQKLIDHAVGLGAIATAKQVEVIDDVIQVVENFAPLIAGI